MPRLSRKTPDPPPGPQHGFITRAPATPDDELEIRIPDFSEHHAFQIRRWPTRDGDLPAVGDEVLVIRDDRREPWVVAWWPL